jgi:hypothetical protein
MAVSSAVETEPDPSVSNLSKMRRSWWSGGGGFVPLPLRDDINTVPKCPKKQNKVHM